MAARRVCDGGYELRLRQLRQRRGVSQQVVADMCGVSRGAVWAYEQGRAAPSAAVLCRMADYFDVSVDALLGRGVGGRGFR